MSLSNLSYISRTIPFHHIDSKLTYKSTRQAIINTKSSIVFSFSKADLHYFRDIKSYIDMIRCMLISNAYK